jgi:hypothetical protein
MEVEELGNKRQWEVKKEDIQDFTDAEGNKYTLTIKVTPFKSLLRSGLQTSQDLDLKKLMGEAEELIKPIRQAELKLKITEYLEKPIQQFNDTYGNVYTLSLGFREFDTRPRSPLKE